MDSNKPDILRLTDKADTAFTTQNFSEAFEIYRRIEKASNKHPDANFKLALMYMEQSEQKKALMHFKAAISASPHSTSFWLGYIAALVRMNRVADAQKVYEQAVHLGASDDKLSAARDLIEHSEEVFQRIEKVASLINNNERKVALELMVQTNDIFPSNIEIILPLGDLFSMAGDKHRAKDLYFEAIQINALCFRAYYRLGLLFSEDGDDDTALQFYKTAVSINPKAGFCFNNMGAIYVHKNDHEKARANFQKCVSLDSDNVSATYNLACLEISSKNYDEAIRLLKVAIRVDPTHLNSWNNLGSCFLSKQKNADALNCFAEAISMDSTSQQALQNYATAITRVRFSNSNIEALKIIEKILVTKCLVRPSDLSSVATSLWASESSVSQLLEKAELGEDIDLDQAISCLEHIPALMNMLEVCPISDLRFENLFSYLRSRLLVEMLGEHPTDQYFRFQMALAKQCHLNEYVYGLSKTDKELVSELSAEISAKLDSGEKGLEQLVACIAGFQNITDFNWHTNLKCFDLLEPILESQIYEPETELTIIKSLPKFKLTSDTDDVSEKVKAQYEENPYPRWVDLGLPYKSLMIEEIFHELDLRCSNKDIFLKEKIDILAAGGGTGQQSISTACRYKNCEVLAIDLSARSLAYSARKAQELGIENLEHLQADILDLVGLGKTFDIIECAGVLHHMRDPYAGWEILVSLLNPGGLLKIGLYSKLARQHISKIRAEIAELNGFDRSSESILQFRQRVIKSEKAHHQKLITSSDFYSLSMVRDLLFHVQEHLFTLPQISDHLRRLGLEFSGFEEPHIKQKFLASGYSEQDCYDLEKWESFEEAYPDTFRGMYQFWCQKVGS